MSVHLDGDELVCSFDEWLGERDDDFAIDDSLFPFRSLALARRKALSASIRKQYGNTRVPVIVGTRNMTLTRCHFLIHELMSIGKLLHILRVYIDRLPHSSALFIITREGNHMPAASTSVRQVADRFGDRDDGFLYLTLFEEAVFG